MSTYLAKTFGRRSMARTTAKIVAAFLIVPIIVFWDALLAYSLTFNSWILVLGPPQALRVFDDIIDSNGRVLTLRCRAAVFRVLSCAIVQRGEVHPVLYILYRHCKARLGGKIDEQYMQDMDDVSLLIHQTLPCLPKHDQLLVLRVLALTLVVDGSISAKERKYMITALETCGCAPMVDELMMTTRKYAQGKLTYDDYRGMFADLHSRKPKPMSPAGRRALFLWRAWTSLRDRLKVVWMIF